MKQPIVSIGGERVFEGVVHVKGAVTTFNTFFKVDARVLIPKNVPPDQRMAVAITRLTNEIAQSARCPVQEIMLMAAESFSPRCDHKAHKYLGIFASGELQRMTLVSHIGVEQRELFTGQLKMVKEHIEQCPLARAVIAQTDAPVRSMKILTWPAAA